jgi:hypothetical protein
LASRITCPGRALGDTHIQRLVVDADAYGAAVVDRFQRHSELRTRVATLRRYALLISASPALGSTPRCARLAHPVPFGFHGRYFADLRA